MISADEFSRSPDNQHAAASAACGVTALGIITFAGSDAASGVAGLFVAAVLAVPGCYVWYRVRRVVPRSETEWWIPVGVLPRFYVVRGVVLVLKLAVCVLVGPVATLVCVFLALRRPPPRT